MPDGETLPLFPEDSPASRSAKQGSEQAQAMTATSGRRCYELYKSYPRHTSWAKMFLDCFLSTGVWFSRLCALTWSVKDTTYSRCIIRLRASVHRTSGTGYSLWPTASSRDWKDSPGMAQTGTNPDGSERKRTDQLARAVYARMWPTPRASDADKGGPNQRDSAGNYALPGAVHHAGEAVNGQLNPTFVEYLMGFPENWTEV